MRDVIQTTFDEDLMQSTMNVSQTAKSTASRRAI